MRKKGRAFDFYPDDFLAGTTGMEPMLFKAHTRLFLFMYSMGGPLKYDLRTLARQIECFRQADAKKLIDRLIETKSYFVKDGYLHFQRVDDQLAVKAKSSSNRAPIEPERKANSPKNATQSTKRGTNNVPVSGRLPPLPQESPPPDPPSKKTPSPPLASLALPVVAREREDFTLEAEEPKTGKTATIIGATRQLEAFRHELTPVVGPALVDDIVATRRSKHGALTGNAGRLLARALRNCGDPVAAAEEMVVRGWLTVKPHWIASGNTARAPPAAYGSPPPPAGEYSDENMLKALEQIEARNARRRQQG